MPQLSLIDSEGTHTVRVGATSGRLMCAEVRTFAKNYAFKMSKITVLLPDDEFARFDAYCEERGFKKSTLICRLIRDYLEMEKYPSQSILNLEHPTTTKEKN